MKQKKKIFSDFDINFSSHPLTGDVNVLFDEDAIKNSLKNILLTDYYERPFNSTFGCNIRGLLFENASQFVTDELESRIRTAINNFEKRIELQSVIVQADEENNGYSVTIIFVSVLSDIPTSIDLFIERVL